MFYFTPLRGFFSPFPRGTISLSVTQEYLALRGGPRRFTRDSTCPMLLGIRQIDKNDHIRSLILRLILQSKIKKQYQKKLLLCLFVSQTSL